jgi:hypothetical protein
MIGRRPRAATLGLLTLAAVSACTSSEPVTDADKRETESTLAAAMTALSDAAAGGHPPLRPSARDLKQLGVDIPPAVSVGSFERVGRGASTTYQLCLVHDGGYWVAASSDSPTELQSGDGGRCRLHFGTATTPPGEQERG